MRNKELLKRIFILTEPYRGRLLIAMAAMVVVAALSAAQAYMVKPLLDEIFINKDARMLNILPLALIAIFVIKGIFYYIYTYLIERTGQGIIKNLRLTIYQHIQQLPFSFFHKTPTGELISRIMSDVGLLQEGVSSALIGILKSLMQVIFLSAVLFYHDWRLALMSLTFLPLASISIYFFGKRFRTLSTQSQETMAAASNFLHETISGHNIVKAFCRENYENNHFRKIITRLFRTFIRDAQARSLSHPLMEILGGLGIAMILWYGGKQVIAGESTPGTFFSFLTTLILIYEPVKKLSKLNNPVQNGLAAASRIFTLLDIKSTVTEANDAIPLPPMQTDIEFKNVDFAYDNSNKVLTNINLKVKTGEILALVGPSGAGKTSLVNLILRFFDVTKGNILIDNHDIRHVNIKSLREQIAMVTQHTFLFNQTVRENIAYGAAASSDDEIIHAARAAYAMDFIRELPEGFETVIGESGCRLSGGQRQRVSIARALLKNAPILILDEATSALDTESEKEVQYALDNLMKDRTTFVIAHRLSTIRNADRIIVMQDGQIVEEGAHDYLLRKKGVYKLLHDMQI